MLKTSIATTDGALLACLSVCPMSGYELKEFVQRSIGNFWRESYGQLYPGLKRLQSLGYVKSSDEANGKRRKTVYSLTASGRRVLRKSLTEPAAEQVPRNELLMKVFFGSEVGPEDIAGHIHRHTTSTQTKLDHYRAIRASLMHDHAEDPRLRFWLSTIRFGELRCQAELKWCTEMRTTLASPRQKETL